MKITVSLDRAKKFTKTYKNYEILKAYMLSSGFHSFMGIGIFDILNLELRGCDVDWVLDLCRAEYDDHLVGSDVQQDR